MSQKIPLKQIVQGKTQVRVSLNQDAVDGLVEAYENGDSVPPISLFTNDNKEYFIADGFHRLAAQVECGHDLIDADVAAGGEEEAFIHNCLFNGQHRGVPMSRADKRKAARMALERWGDSKSNRTIAKIIGISHTILNEERKADGSESPSKKNSAPSKRAKGCGKISTSTTQPKGKPAPQEPWEVESTPAKEEFGEFESLATDDGDREVTVIIPPEVIAASPSGPVLETLEAMRLTIGKAVRMADEANQSRKYGGQVKSVQCHLNQALEAIKSWKSQL